MKYWIKTIALFQEDADVEGAFVFDIREIEAYNLASDNTAVTIWLKSGVTITVNMTIKEIEEKLEELNQA